MQQSFVRDGNHRVNALTQFSQADVGLHHPATPLEVERLRHDGDRQRIQFCRQTGDDRSRARARAAAKPGRHKDHVRAFEHFDNLLGVFERGVAPDNWVCSRTETFRELAAELYLDRRTRALQGLQVCIGDKELDALDACFDHAVDGVAAAAADADYFNSRAGDGWVVVYKNINAVARLTVQCHHSHSSLSATKC